MRAKPAKKANSIPVKPTGKVEIDVTTMQYRVEFVATFGPESFEGEEVAALTSFEEAIQDVIETAQQYGSCEITRRTMTGEPVNEQTQ